MSPLPLALAIVCAFSAPDCQTLQTTSVLQSQGRYWSACDFDHKPSDYLSQYDARCNVITVSEQMRQPAIVAELLTYEATNAQHRGAMLAGRTIEAETAANIEGHAEALWFQESFGAPVFASALESTAWQQALAEDLAGKAQYAASRAHA